jgi:hypothetical protein
MQATKGRSALFILVLGVAFLAGCAQVKRQAFNGAAASHVKNVVVTQSQNQDEYYINILGHPGMSFGLIGGLIAAADMQAKTTRLTQAVDATETRVQERFGQKLAERLKAAGYTTQLLVLPKDAKEPQALALTKQQSGGDAALFVELHAGYWAAGPTTDYFPRLVARVKAVDVKSDKVLYEETLTYGYAMPQADTVHLASEATYRFKDIDALIADPTKTRQGLYAGLDAMADQIVRDLKKQ